MKKIVAVILTVFLLLNIASCGKNSFGGPEKSYGNFVVVLDADESNPVLCSKDGKVYSKETNKLYSGIPSGCYGDI